MPRTLMGVPADAAALADSGVRLRAGPGPGRRWSAVLPATRLDGQDVSVGWLVEERFGREVVDRLVEPLLGGVYAGHAREISARAAVPQVVALLDRDRSMMRGGRRPRRAGRRRRPGVRRARRRDRPAARRGRRGRRARRAHRRRRCATWPAPPTAAGTWSSGSTPRRRGAARRRGGARRPRRAPTARLLADVAPDAALELARIEYASMAIVTLAFRGRDLPDVAGLGLPGAAGRRRVGQGGDVLLRQVGLGPRRRGGRRLLVMRCSIGRHREEAAAPASPTTSSSTLALADLADAVGLAVRPVDAHVQRWGGGLPQYAVGHLDRVARIRAAVAAVPGLAVCGAAYDGLGHPGLHRLRASSRPTQVLDALAPAGE